MVLGLAWSVLQAVLYTASAAWSSGFADNSSMSVSFRAALRFPDQLHQTSLDVFWSTGKNFSRGFLQYGLYLFPLFFRLCTCHTTKSFLQHDLEIVFHPWVTKFVHLQFLRLGTFPLGRRLEGKGDFAAYQPTISIAVYTGHHYGV